MVGAVEEVVAVLVEGEEGACAEESLVLVFGDIDGGASELAGEVSEFGGIVGFPELIAEGAAFFAEAGLGRLKTGTVMPWGEEGFPVGFVWALGVGVGGRGENRSRDDGYFLR